MRGRGELPGRVAWSDGAHEPHQGSIPELASAVDPGCRGQAGNPILALRGEGKNEDAKSRPGRASSLRRLSNASCASTLEPRRPALWRTSASSALRDVQTSIACDRLVQPACLGLPLLDPRVAREVGCSGVAMAGYAAHCPQHCKSMNVVPQQTGSLSSASPSVRSCSSSSALTKESNRGSKAVANCNGSRR